LGFDSLSPSFMLNDYQTKIWNAIYVLMRDSSFKENMEQNNFSAAYEHMKGLLNDKEFFPPYKPS
jgi:hypothetical protein